MGVQGEAMGKQLLRELNRRAITDPTSATPMQAGEAVGLDALEVASAMTWLLQERLVGVRGSAEPLWDSYTSEVLEPTEAGRRYLSEHLF